MRSYMQDEKGTGTKTLKNGRIKRLTSSKGDGIMDQATVFAEGLNLPRMILPLADGIAVVETDSTSVWMLRDTKGTGVADEKTLLYQGKAGDPNHSVEHQDSGLDWNVDNWINISYGRERYRFTDGTWRMENYPLHLVAVGPHARRHGARVLFRKQHALPRRAAPARVLEFRRQERRADAARGRGHPARAAVGSRRSSLPKISARATTAALCSRPAEARCSPRSAGRAFSAARRCRPDARGDYFFCDPTIHVIRRAKIENRDGRVFLTNAYGEDEFFNSPDIYCRPVWTATGPGRLPHGRGHVSRHHPGRAVAE